MIRRIILSFGAHGICWVYPLLRGAASFFSKTDTFLLVLVGLPLLFIPPIHCREYDAAVRCRPWTWTRPARFTAAAALLCYPVLNEKKTHLLLRQQSFRH